MRLPRRLIAMLAPIAALAISVPASASLILALDLPTLVTRSDQISVVDVVSTKAAWNAEHDRIVTTIDVTVVDCWKGAAAPGSHVQIVQPGGTVGELTMRIEGMPHFQRGNGPCSSCAARPSTPASSAWPRASAPSAARPAGGW